MVLLLNECRACKEDVADNACKEGVCVEDGFACGPYVAA
jgi:hypothetical protein